MLRYRIAKDPKGRFFVLPALIGIVPLEETYRARSAAQETADWLNGLKQGPGSRGQGPGVRAQGAVGQMVPPTAVA